MIGHPLKVRELLDEIQRGQVLLPEIQRSYVWKGPQVAKLLDSLYHEYPVGQILLWDTGALQIITKALEGSKEPVLPSAGQPKIVLDGQQRLTSLYLALGGAREDGVSIYFHLETEQFQNYISRMKADRRWIPVRPTLCGEINDLAILSSLQEQGVLKVGDEKSSLYLDRLQRLKKIGEYKFPIEIFKSEDYEEVTELFVRINSAGTRLRLAELALAQLALRLPGTIVDAFEKAIDEYEEAGFELDARFLTRALIVAGTNQSRFRYLTEFWKKPEKEIQQAWASAKRGVDSAVNFVRKNAGFESSEWLSSLNALIPLSAYFSKYERIQDGCEDALLRWFYLASLRGRYTGSGETAMDEDLKAVQQAKPIDLLMENVRGLGRALEVTADEFDDAGIRNPLFPMTYAAAKRARAKDWFTGVELATDAVGREHEIQIHHVFPKALLNELRVARKDRDEVANLAFLAARPNRQISKALPEKYLAEIAAKNPERLVAQCIPMDASLWKLERFQDFLSERRKLLAEAVNGLIRERSVSSRKSKAA